MELAADEEGRKPGGSWRVVPLVKPLRLMLRKAWIAQGRPNEGKVCPPRQYSPSGLLALGDIQRRVHREWRDLGLEPIGLHESRHTAATWLDHAGVSPKVASHAHGPQDAGVPAGRRVDYAGATPTRCPASWNGRAIFSTSSSSSAQR